MFKGLHESRRLIPFLMTLFSGRNNCFYHMTMCYDHTTEFDIRPRVLGWGI